MNLMGLRQLLSIGAFAACAVLAGCVEMEPRETTPPPEAVNADRLYQQGELDRAAQAYLDLAGSSSGAEREHYR